MFSNIISFQFMRISSKLLLNLYNFFLGSQKASELKIHSKMWLEWLMREKGKKN